MKLMKPSAVFALFVFAVMATPHIAHAQSGPALGPYRKAICEARDDPKALLAASLALEKAIGGSSWSGDHFIDLAVYAHKAGLWEPLRAAMDSGDHVFMMQEIKLNYILDWVEFVGPATNDAIADRLKAIKAEDRDRVLRYVVTPLLGAMGRARDLTSFFPIGASVYTDNLFASGPIDELMRAGLIDEAVALYRKYTFGYHAGNMLQAVALPLLRSGDIVQLSQFLIDERKRSTDYKKDGEFRLCIAEGKSQDFCARDVAESRLSRKLQLFDKGRALNCYLQPPSAKADQCLADLERDFAASGQTFSEELLGATVYYWDLEQGLLTYEAGVGQIDRAIPDIFFEEPDFRETHAIIARIAYLLVHDREEDGRALMSRLREAATSAARKKSGYSGAASILSAGQGVSGVMIASILAEEMSIQLLLKYGTDAVLNYVSIISKSREMAEIAERVALRGMVNAGNWPEIVDVLSSGRVVAENHSPSILGASLAARRAGDDVSANALQSKFDQSYCSAAQAPQLSGFNNGIFVIPQIFASSLVRSGLMPREAIRPERK